MGKGLMMLGRVLDWEGLLQEVCVGGDACVGGAFWLELPLLALLELQGREAFWLIHSNPLPPTPSIQRQDTLLYDKLLPGGERVQKAGRRTKEYIISKAQTPKTRIQRSNPELRIQDPKSEAGSTGWGK